MARIEDYPFILREQLLDVDGSIHVYGIIGYTCYFLVTVPYGMFMHDLFYRKIPKSWCFV